MTAVYKLSLFLTALVLLAQNVRSAARWDVSVVNFEFINSPATVNVGDTIRWIWAEGTHNTTSMAIPSGAAPWGQPLNASATQFDYIVTTPGSYSYVCTFHAGAMSETFTASGSTPVQTPVKGDNSFAVTVEPNEIVAVTYTVSYSAPVSVGFYDLTGKLLKHSNTETQPAGEHSYDFDIHDVKSGMYFVVVQIGSERKTRKVTVR